MWVKFPCKVSIKNKSKTCLKRLWKLGWIAIIQDWNNKPGNLIMTKYCVNLIWLYLPLHVQYNNNIENSQIMVPGSASKISVINLLISLQSSLGGTGLFSSTCSPLLGYWSSNFKLLTSKQNHINWALPGSELKLLRYEFHLLIYTWLLLYYTLDS